MSISWMELKDARALRDLTQAQLAEAVGVHQKTIANWESTGVPPKSEYKVRRVLGRELQFIEERAAGHIPENENFLEWKDQQEWQDQVLRERLSEDLAAGRLHEPNPIQLEQEEAERLAQIEEAQAQFISKVSRIKRLSEFSNVDLLKELVRREQLLEHASSSDVSGREDNVDSRRQSDYARVADENDETGEDES